MTVLRRCKPQDAEPIYRLRVANRAYTEPWEPDSANADERYTLEYARSWVARPHHFVIVDDAEIVGGLSLSNLELAIFRSAMVGYWVSEHAAGRGLGTRAVAASLEYAFGDLGLHRVEAGTRVENRASQIVLERNRFTRVGMLRRHIRIGGVWRDHYLYERLEDDD